MRVWSWTPPWWLMPWREVRELRDHDGARIDELNRAYRKLAGVRSQLSEAERQLRNLQGAQTPEGSLPSDGQPDFVMVGIPRGRMGVRLMAARKMAGMRFGMTDMQDPPPRWVISTALVEPLIIDKPTYDEAVQRLGEIWANWLRERPELQADDGRYRGAPRRPAGQLGQGQAMLPPGG